MAADSRNDEAETDTNTGEWVEYEVAGRTVDLTELRAANASLLSEFGVANGTYTTTVVHVSDVDATLLTGESVDVKLPSETLKITEGFQVENESRVDFVFDIAVHKAGNSGRYILRPVISESGTDVPIDPVDSEADRERDEEAAGLNATVVSDVSSDGNVTIAVTGEGSPVENATVRVNGESVGTTGADGRMTALIPDGEELEVGVTHDDVELELDRERDPRSATTAESPATTPTPIP